jgi:hypothetical protein
MPLPQPKPREKKDEFIQRCINDPKMKTEFPDTKQRAAVCYAQAKK